MADIIDALDGSEDILLVDTGLASLVQVVGKDIEEQLRVGIGVDVTMGILVQELTEFFGVDQVSVLKKIKSVVTRGCEWMGLVKRKKEAPHPTDDLSFSLSLKLFSHDFC